MKTKTNIAVVARKLFHHKNGVRGIKLMHPNRDWMIGIVGAITIIVGMVAWSVFTYYEQREKIANTTDVTIATVPSYNAELVAQALDIAQARTDLFDSINAGIISSPPVAPAINQEVSTTTSPTATTTSPLGLDDQSTEATVTQSAAEAVVADPDNESDPENLPLDAPEDSAPVQLVE